MDGDQKKFSNYSYPAMTKTQGSFRLNVEAGEFTDSEILVMLGENGTGEDANCFRTPAGPQSLCLQCPYATSICIDIVLPDHCIDNKAKLAKPGWLQRQ